MSLALIFSVFSCTDDFEDMNTKPNALDEVNPAFFIAGMQQQVFANYQRNVNLFPDLYSQYFANTVGGFASGRYVYVDGWIGNQWKEHYTSLLRKSIAIKEQFGENPLYSNALAINEIFTCYWWSRMTDTYGDIPYFGAGESESVPYNPQKEIYTDLLSRLKNAVDSLVEDNSKYSIEAGYDLMYGSDIQMWKKFGNSLRLRMAMRISNVDPETAKTAIADAVSSGVMTSNNDVAKVPMWKDGWYDYIHQMLWSWDNQRVSRTFTNHLYGLSSVGEDPRAPIWLAYKRKNENEESVPKTKEEAGESTYKGFENGYSSVMPEDRNDRATINLEGSYVDFSGEGNNAMYCPIMFYSEVLFLQAEAALRGWIAGDANALYKDGIQASMDYVGVDGESSKAYVDGVEDLTGSNEAKLKSIITQKWIANFPNGVEAWADFRRTDYPDLTLPYDGVSGNASVAPDTYVKRIRYPNNQHNLNEASMPAALNTYDSDRMDIKLWWDVKGTEEKGADGLMDSNF